MGEILDIGPLRSLVAVADCGGFQRAASTLYLSQAAVSQHVRRLERTAGRPLVERQGRGSRFTADGERLLVHARRILALHDEALSGFGIGAEQLLMIGSTEHAASQLLPGLVNRLGHTLPGHRVRFRLDRGFQLRSDLGSGRIDLALLIGAHDDPRASVVGELELTWYSAPDWAPPARDQPTQLVAFDDPCALRSRALDTLAQHGVPAEVGCEAAHLAGVQAAVRAGFGVGLMATLGQSPEGLVARQDLPTVRPLPLSIWARHGLPTELTAAAVQALREQLLGVAPAAHPVALYPVPRGA